MEMVNHLRKFPALLFKGRAIEEATPSAPALIIVETLINQELPLNLKNIHKLNINSKSALLRVEFINDEMARISLQGQLKAPENQASPKLEAQREGSLQRVSLEFPSTLQPIHCQLLIKLYIPNSYKHSINIKSTSGTLDIKGGNLEELQLSTISGDLKIEDLRANRHILKTISGSISLSNTEGSIEAFSTSGDIAIDSSSIGNNISINTTSGNSIIKLPFKTEPLLDGITATGRLIQLPEGVHKASELIAASTEKLYLRSVSGDFQLLQK